MKKRSLIFLFIVSAALVFSENNTDQKSEGKSDKKINLEQIDGRLEGKAKLGFSIGTITGLTFGYQLSELLELNAAVDIFDFDSLSFSMNALIPLFDLEAGNNVFPVSAGPGIVFRSGNREKTDILGIIRSEYNFSGIPLNLYIEGGLGIRIVPDLKAAGEAALGLRYIF